MMLVLLYNITTWTFIAGILKEWTFCVILFVFLTTFLVHKVLFQQYIISQKQKGFIREAERYCPENGLLSLNIPLFTGLGHEDENWKGYRVRGTYEPS